MNRIKHTLLAALSFAAVISFSACKGNVNPSKPEEITTGTITGKAVYQNADESSGITVTLEKTDGLRSLSVVRSIELEFDDFSARSVAGNSTTDKEGNYTFTDVEEGVYTIYASSKDSTEKAVTTNVVVERNASVTAEDLKLTATGNISGKITLNQNDTDNYGFIVYVAGTSYSAATDIDGSFVISGIPAGNTYSILILYGTYSYLWKTGVLVKGHENTDLGSIDFNLETIVDEGVLQLIDNKINLYKINYYLQNLEDDNYSLDKTDYRCGIIGNTTAINPEIPAGYSLVPIAQKTINKDGSTVVEVYFKRNIYTVTFDSLGGTEVSPVTAKFGTQIELPSITKDRNYFKGWYDNKEYNGNSITSVIVNDNITVYAKWETFSNEVEVKFILYIPDYYYIDGILQQSPLDFAEFASTNKLETILTVTRDSTVQVPEFTVADGYFATGRIIPESNIEKENEFMRFVFNNRYFVSENFIDPAVSGDIVANDNHSVYYVEILRNSIPTYLYSWDTASHFNFILKQRDFISYEVPGTGDGYIDGKGHPDFVNYDQIMVVPHTASFSNVEDSADVNGKPVIKSDKDITGLITSKDSFNQWFNDVPGINKSYYESLHLFLMDASKKTYKFASEGYYHATSQYGYNENLKLQDPKGYSSNRLCNIFNGDYRASVSTLGFTDEIVFYAKSSSGFDITMESEGDMFVYINDINAYDFIGISGNHKCNLNITEDLFEKYLINPECVKISIFVAHRYIDPNFTIQLSGLLPISQPADSELILDNIYSSLYVLSNR